MGLGLIGRQRLAALERLGGDVEIAGTFDPNPSGGATSTLRSVDAVFELQPDLLLIATPHSASPAIIARALKLGIRVHSEKPMGSNLLEAQAIRDLDVSGSDLTVGFNYRFMGGVAAIIEDARQGYFGEIIRVEMILGHGGSPSDRTSWKLDPDRAGGGCLLDPGVHLFDLLDLIDDDWTVDSVSTWSGFWSTGIEEDATIVLHSDRVPVAVVTTSIVRWRSEFLVRVIGTDGYGLVTGRGRSYGAQEYRRGIRWGWSDSTSQAESERLVLVDDCENSFYLELADLIRSTPTDRRVASSSEAVRSMKIYDRVAQRANI